jgi:hypothetical protein
VGRHAEFVESKEGQRVQGMLWDETLDEVVKFVAIPV